ncbi:fumarylacetoacetate hydrolase family protein [Leptonema illini]|uniref:fumarylacetoacetate hydrolase family protein n=1 Tax=Leptonema illini TaxID=183 RepID=UPI001B7FC80D|nr:fumarylacetoacetate hydrolase family protein [Leptonema illini]
MILNFLYYLSNKNPHDSSPVHEKASHGFRSMGIWGINFRPQKLVCVGRNYAAHAQELGNSVPDEPVLFIKPGSALSNRLLATDRIGIRFEGEIALLIRGVRPVAVALDLTLQDLQNSLKEKGLPWERSKAFRESALLGPFVALPDGMEHLSLELFINEELRQKGGVTDMLFPPDRLIKEIDREFGLEDNDVILTGTPAGAAGFKAGDRFDGRILYKGGVIASASWVAE